eukprot:TRINITY_DN19331_c0_g3_i2.p1 TRINITY_DN19331_c0_g3~~TRINITY_DN19331_c0_g3_i2.p1  ORF type:complete len:449 (-),score=89.18 TRINITY_DN19331_c0_g3_i2:44-1390(-)
MQELKKQALRAVREVRKAKAIEEADLMDSSIGKDEAGDALAEALGEVGNREVISLGPDSMERVAIRSDKTSYSLMILTTRGRRRFGGLEGFLAEELILTASQQPWYRGLTLKGVRVTPHILVSLSVVAQAVESVIVELATLFEHLQKDRFGLCTVLDVANLLAVAGFVRLGDPIKPRRVIKVPPPPPKDVIVDNVKGKRGKASPVRATSPAASPSKGAKKGKKGAEPTAAEIAAEKENARVAAVRAERRQNLYRIADMVPKPPRTSIPRSSLTHANLIRNLLIHCFHTLVLDGEVRTLSPAPRVGTAPCSDSTAQLGRLSSMLDEAVNLHDEHVRTMEIRAQAVQPPAKNCAVHQQELLAAHIPLTFDGFVTVMVVSFAVCLKDSHMSPVDAANQLKMCCSDLCDVSLRSHVGESSPTVSLPLAPLPLPAEKLPVKLKAVTDNKKKRS